MSPDGRYEAAIIERNCGATTDYVTLLRLTDRHAWLVKSQDVMQVSTSWPLAVSWSGPRALIVEYPARRPPPLDKTHGPPDHWEDVAITLKESASR